MWERFSYNSSTGLLLGTIEVPVEVLTGDSFVSTPSSDSAVTIKGVKYTKGAHILRVGSETRVTGENVSSPVAAAVEERGEKKNKTSSTDTWLATVRFLLTGENKFAGVWLSLRTKSSLNATVKAVLMVCFFFFLAYMLFFTLLIHAMTLFFCFFLVLVIFFLKMFLCIILVVLSCLYCVLSFDPSIHLLHAMHRPMSPDPI